MLDYDTIAHPESFRQLLGLLVGARFLKQPLLWVDLHRTGKPDGPTKVEISHVQHGARDVTAIYFAAPEAEAPS